MKKRRLFGILLILALMLTMMPALGLSQPAYADGDSPSVAVSPEYSGNVTIRRPLDEGNPWYFIASAEENWQFDHWSYIEGGQTIINNNPSWTVPASDIGSMSDITAHFTTTQEPPVFYYPLWVGETRVTSLNKDNVLNDSGKTVKYNPDTKTLTLNGATILGKHTIGDNTANVYSEGIDLKVVLNGSNTVGSESGEGSADDAVGVTKMSDKGGSLTIEGPGSLTANSKRSVLFAQSKCEINNGQVMVTSKEDCGIFAWGDVSILKGTVTANGNNYGIISYGAVSVEGGDVTASGNYCGIYTYGNNINIKNGNVVASATGLNGRGILAEDSDVNISGGTVTATGKEGGIYATNNVIASGGTIVATEEGGGVEPTSVSVADYEHGPAGISAEVIEINKGIDSLIASGEDKAAEGNVKNAITGTGWTDTAGTKDKTKIEINKDGKALTFKKVQFPEKVDPKPAPTPSPAANPLTVTTTAKTTTRATTIKWTWNAVDGASKYKVAYHKVGSKKWKVKTTKKTKYVLKGQKIKGLYEYKVAAVTASGDVWSDTSCRYFKTVKTKAKFSKGALKVSWKKDKGAAGYEVFIARNKKMDGAQVIQVAPDSKSYKVTGLAKGRYYVKVRPMKNYNGVTYTGILCKARKVKVK